MSLRALSQLRLGLGVERREHSERGGAAKKTVMLISLSRTPTVKVDRGRRKRHARQPAALLYRQVAVGDGL